MKERLMQLATRVDAMTLRERALLFAALVGGLLMVWNGLLMSPLEAEREAKLQRLDSVKTDIEGLNRAVRETLAQRDADPDAEVRRQLAQVAAAISALERRVGERMGGLIGPQQMARVLEQMLVHQSGLSPVRVESLGSEPLVPQDVDSALSSVYRHRMLMELEGSYLDGLAYLQALQALPWSFYWDEVSIELLEYPRTIIRLEVSTLSLAEGWIGV